MGSFLGHLLPGIFFIIFGIWFSFKFPYRYFTKHQKKGRKSKCNIDIIEATVKVAFPSLGILLEQVTNNGPQFHLTSSGGNYLDGNNWSHCTMYMFFVYAGIADFLVLKFPKVTPRGVDNLTLGLGLVIEGYLFYFHTHGRPDLDVRIHVLLLLAIWSGAAAAVILGILDALFRPGGHGNGFPHHQKGSNEYIQLSNTDIDIETTPLNETDDSKVIPDSQNNAATRNGMSPEMQILTKTLKEALYETAASQSCQKDQLQILLQMTLTVSVLLQGTWFCQIAMILYPPGRAGWDSGSHLNVQFATIFFSWHLASILVYVSVIYVIICRLKNNNHRMKL